MNADPGPPRDSRNIATSSSAGVACMQLFVLESCQWLPRTPEEIFYFYADAFNLEQLTPPWLRFQVVTPPPITMATGAEIDYRLRLHGFPISWRSRIKAWEPPFRFVDEQIRGRIDAGRISIRSFRKMEARVFRTASNTDCGAAGSSTGCWCAAICGRCSSSASNASPPNSEPGKCRPAGSISRLL